MCVWHFPTKHITKTKFMVIVLRLIKRVCVVCVGMWRMPFSVWKISEFSLRFGAVGKVLEREIFRRCRVKVCVKEVLFYVAGSIQIL